MVTFWIAVMLLWILVCLAAAVHCVVRHVSARYAAPSATRPPVPPPALPRAIVLPADTVWPWDGRVPPGLFASQDRFRGPYSPWAWHACGCRGAILCRCDD